MALEQLSQFQPHDSRRYFMLPQAPEDAGFYVYGTPPRGRGQYAHPAMMTMILFVEREWAAIDRRKFGVGNISQENGPAYEKHKSHRNGLQVDIRPIRKDGRHEQVFWYQVDDYDREATGKLIALFHAYTGVHKILYNDKHASPFVTHFKNHDHHFHVELTV
jgi:penicillin-insensitive murein DD-endopeptidase